MTTIALRPLVFGAPNASRAVDVFRVFVCSTEAPSQFRAVGDAFTTAAEATAAADVLYSARVAELSPDAPDGAFVSSDSTRTYTVAPGTRAEWGERIEVRVRRAGSDEWTAI